MTNLRILGFRREPLIIRDVDRQREPVGISPSLDALSMIEQRRTEDYDPEPSLADDARMRQQAIGIRLRQLFDDIVNEPVPEEFLDILRNADKRSTEGG